MTTPPSFPTLPGLTWPVKKTPKFATLTALHVSGREVRSPKYQNPIWEFEVSVAGLDSAGTWTGAGLNTLQALFNLYMSCQGAYGTFLFTDPTDCMVSTQPIAIGDGVTSSFTFVRQIAYGGFLEPVGWVTSVSSVTVAGVASSTWSLATPNTLSFTSPPASGALIGATFSYAFQCRFSDDTLDAEEFMSGLWEAKSIKFQSVRPY